MLKKLQKLMMLCLLLMGISMNVKAEETVTFSFVTPNEWGATQCANSRHTDYKGSTNIPNDILAKGGVLINFIHHTSGIYCHLCNVSNGILYGTSTEVMKFTAPKGKNIKSIKFNATGTTGMGFSATNLDKKFTTEDCDGTQNEGKVISGSSSRVTISPCYVEWIPTGAVPTVFARLSATAQWTSIEVVLVDGENQGGDPTPGPTTYTVTVNKPAGSETMTASPNSNVEAGATVELSQTPATGYKFNGWSVNNGAVNVSNNQFEMPASDVIVTGTYSKIYTITKGAMEHGDVTLSSETATMGETVTLTPVPARGYELSSLTVTPTSGVVSVSGSNIKTFIMPASAVEVNATFSKIPPMPTPELNATLDFSVNQLGIDDLPDDCRSDFSNVDGKTFNGITFIAKTQDLNNYYPTLILPDGSTISNANAIRMTAGDNLLTMKAPRGYAFKSIVFTFGSQYSNNIKQFSVGSLDKQVRNATWRSPIDVDVTSLSISAESGLAITTMTFILEPLPINVTINPTYRVGTFYSSFETVIPAGTDAFTGRLDGNTLILTRLGGAGDKIPANCGVVLKGDGGDFAYSNTGATFSGRNDLVGTDVDVDDWKEMMNGDKVLVLGVNNGNIGFYNYEGATLGAHKAFITLNAIGGQDSEHAAIRMEFPGEATAIKSVESTDNSRVMYNLAGQRVNASAKGIVIMNGKKILK